MKTFAPHTLQHGLIITLEGTDGCGKSTQAKLLCDQLRYMGYDPLHVREPGGTPVADKLRAILIDPGTGDIHRGVEVLVFAAAKIDLYQKKIAPALAEGRVVVCERGYVSMEAYQSVGRGVALETIDRLRDFLVDRHLGMDIGQYYNLQVLLDQSVEQSRARCAGRVLDRFESEGGDFLERVTRHYRARFPEEGTLLTSHGGQVVTNYKRVDVEGLSEVETLQSLLAVVRPLLQIFKERRRA